jgi:hypothetical protein
MDACRLALCAAAAATMQVAHGQCEVQKLLAPDGGPNRRFGRGIAASEVRLFVYSFGPDGSGQVRVFDRVSSGVWSASALLAPWDGQRGSSFGLALAQFGEFAYIGAPGFDDGYGAVYIFRHDGARWVPYQKIRGQGAVLGAQFGRSVAVDGDRLVVGANRDGGNGGQAGAIYVFERDAVGTWLQRARLIANDGAPCDVFGTGVDIEGDTVVAGAPLHPPAGGEPGALYVFKRDGSGAWRQVQKIMAQGRTSSDRLGEDVALEGNVLYAGAESYPSGQRQGAVFVFERPDAGSPFGQVGMLRLPNPGTNEYFGYRIDVVGDRLLASANGRYGHRGAAYVLERQGLGWRLIAELVASDGVPLDQFGYDVALLADGTAFIGSIFNDNENGENAGAVYVFDLDCPAEIRELTVLEGQLLSGGIPELRHSDDSYLVTRAKVTGQVSQPHLMRLHLAATTRRLNPDTIEIRVEGRITDVSAQTTLFLRDWVTDDLVAVSQYPMTMEETVRTITVPNASRFIRSGDGRIELEVRQIVFFPFTLGGFQTYFDQIEIHAR